MSKVFIHGNPETNAIWGPLFDALTARGVTDLVTLSPPGFGAPIPDRWDATAMEYRTWLKDELARFDEVDIVAHDWGAGHLFGVLADKLVTVRSWASDCVGLLHPDYVWHDAAQAWQTPDIGEAAVDAMVTMPEEDFIAAFSSLGMTTDIARAVRKGIDPVMGRCVLGLYRSAIQPAMSELGARFVDVSPPNGLVIVADNDHFAGSVEMMTQMADSVGAATVRLLGAGHWWMIEQAEPAAEALVDHWSRFGQSR